jgi:hypothetical protein
MAITHLACELQTDEPAKREKRDGNAYGHQITVCEKRILRPRSWGRPDKPPFLRMG